MIRMLIALIGGIFLAMAYADAFPEGRPKQANVPIEDTPTDAPAPAPAPVLLASLKIETPPAPMPVNLLADHASAPFHTPMVVTSDGYLQVGGNNTAQPATDDSTPPPAVDEPTATVRYVTARRVNVRAGPSTDHAIAGGVEFGDAVEILSDPAAPWVHIRIQGAGVDGFMAGRFLQEIQPSG